ncbi:hypothetical protein, partial [Bradyrhizobium sp. NAS96.2]|uniref:hypothetical protein n=1 Tax=Bradyrhizobium sp. NAS96.2 TaxID=1680160 RepID=UPI001AECDD4C
LLERGFAVLCLIGAGLAQLLDVHSHGSVTPGLLGFAWTEKEPAFPLSRRRRGSSNSGTETEKAASRPTTGDQRLKNRLAGQTSGLF